NAIEIDELRNSLIDTAWLSAARPRKTATSASRLAGRRGIAHATAVPPPSATGPTSSQLGASRRGHFVTVDWTVPTIAPLTSRLRRGRSVAHRARPPGGVPASDQPVERVPRAVDPDQSVPVGAVPRAVLPGEVGPGRRVPGPVVP